MVLRFLPFCLPVSERNLVPLAGAHPLDAFPVDLAEPLDWPGFEKADSRDTDLATASGKSVGG